MLVFVLTLTRVPILKRVAEHDEASSVHYCHYRTKSPLYAYIYFLYSCICVCTKYVSHDQLQRLPYDIELCTGARSKGVSDRGGAHVLIGRFFGRRQVYHNEYIWNEQPKPVCPYTTNTHPIIIIMCVPRRERDKSIRTSYVDGYR